MNKLFTAAETAALDSATAVPASTITSTAEPKGSWLHRCFNCPRLAKIARLKIDPQVSVDLQLIDEEGRKSDRHHSALYDLAASNPHVLAASVFSRKHR